MPTQRLTAVVRILVFYFAALVGLIVIGGLLQVFLKLPGVVLTHLLLFFILPLLFVILVEKRPLRPFLRLRMLSGRGFAKSVGLGLLGWLAMFMLGIFVSLLVELLGGKMVTPYSILFEGPVWLSFLAGAIMPAITEELSFRGYIQGALRPLGATGAILVTGILFGVLHMSLIRLLPLTLLGILWAIAAQRSGSTLPSMIMHLFNNGISIGLSLLVQVPTDAEVAALSQIPEAFRWAVLLVIGVMALGLVLAAFFMSRSFSFQDLANPEAAIAEEEGLAATAEPAVISDMATAPAEVQALAGELVKLRQRRRRMLLATGSIVGLLTLAIYLFAVYNELMDTFG